jgi:hypothetical protein
MYYMAVISWLEHKCQSKWIMIITCSGFWLISSWWSPKSMPQYCKKTFMYQNHIQIQATQHYNNDYIIMICRTVSPALQKKFALCLCPSHCFQRVQLFFFCSNSFKLLHSSWNLNGGILLIEAGILLHIKYYCQDGSQNTRGTLLWGT